MGEGEGECGRERREVEEIVVSEMEHLCMFQNIRLFPGIADHTYEYLVEGQPIGKALFHQFCSKDLVLSRCVKFLNDLEELDIAPDEKYPASTRRLFQEYLTDSVSLSPSTLKSPSLLIITFSM